jgi:hypothetical protein
MPTIFSGSFIVGSDVYNLDTTAINQDLRSYSGELLSSFDQSESTLIDCEVIALIRHNNKVIIPFRMGEGTMFMIKIWDMFFDRKVFYNGMSIIELADDYLVSDFVHDAPRMLTPADSLSFTRDQAKSATQRNKNVLMDRGINVDLNYVVTGDNEDDINKAKKLLEIGTFDYEFNSKIQNNGIFIHKIYNLSLSSLSVAGMIGGNRSGGSGGSG